MSKFLYLEFDIDACPSDLVSAYLEAKGFDAYNCKRIWFSNSCFGYEYVLFKFDKPTTGLKKLTSLTDKKAKKVYEVTAFDTSPKRILPVFTSFADSSIVYFRSSSSSAFNYCSYSLFTLYVALRFIYP